ncbi:DNA polymerase III PolC-type [mine drainage metagenome]|uniref:DNA polymerase III PolC-type n=1 Tax=mine drainage metagenome TaxID=410659 RepID=A0A1J5R4L1_9ZZZZ
MSCDFIVFDLETTGLSPNFHEIIQIAATRMRAGQVQKGDHFFSYVRPEMPISGFITAYTGISNRDVAKAPSICEALAAFSDYVGDAVLIAHNGHRFDSKFLAAACEKRCMKSRPVELIDSIHFSKRLFGSTRGTGHGLDVVLARMGVTTINGRRHDARGDVSGLAQAVERMWRKLEIDKNCSDIPRVKTLLPTTAIRR